MHRFHEPADFGSTSMAFSALGLFTSADILLDSLMEMGSHQVSRLLLMRALDMTPRLMNQFRAIPWATCWLSVSRKVIPIMPLTFLLSAAV